MLPRTISRLLVPSLVLGALTIASGALGELDPTLPHTLYAGTPGGPAPFARVDAARSGRAPRLAHAVRPLWWSPNLGTIRGVATGADGQIAVATGEGRLASIDARGRIVWNRSLGGPVIAGPAILSDGTRCVIRADGAVVLVSRDGGSVKVLDLGAGDRAAEPLPTKDGGAVVAVGDRLARVGSSTDVRAEARTDDVVRSLTADDAGAVYATTRSGAVYRWTGAEPRLVGRFSGAPSAEVAATGKWLVSLVARRRLEAIDTGTGARRMLLDQPMFDTLVIPDPGKAAPLTLDGTVVVVDLSSGGQTPFPLWPRTPLTPGAPSSATLLADGRGTLAAGVSGRGLALLTSAGGPAWVSLPHCSEIVDLVPYDARHLVVACGSGSLALLAEEEPAGPHAPPPQPGSSGLKIVPNGG